MGQARYEFQTDVWYCCRAAGVPDDLLEFPAVGRLIALVKVTLAVEGAFEGERLRPDPAKEAVVYAAPSDPTDAEFLHAAGVVQTGAGYALAADRRSLRCLFAPAAGTARYQPLRDYETLPSALSATLPELLSPLGLEFDPGGVRRGAVHVKLDTTHHQLLRVLSRHAGHRVSRVALCRGVGSWRHEVSDRTVTDAIRRLRRAIEPLDLSVSPKAGDEGWALVESRPSGS